MNRGSAGMKAMQQAAVCLVLAALLLPRAPAQEEAAPSRQPEPDAAAQKKALEDIKQIYGERFSWLASDEAREMASRMLKDALRLKGDPAARFVLLREARKLATKGGDLKTAMAAVEETARLFEVDAAALKMEVLTGLSKSMRKPEEIRAFAERCLEVASEAIAADHYKTAIEAAGKAEFSARRIRDAFLLGRARDQANRARALDREYRRVSAWIDAPDGDKAAVGRFYCFLKGDWDRGLKFLAESGDPKLAVLAGEDLAGPSEPARQIVVADGWSAVAERERDKVKKLVILGRARMWYGKALPGLKGIARVKVEKRLEELAKETGSSAIVSLLPMIDPARHASAGTWKREGGGVACASDAVACIMIPYIPPEEYDLKVVVERTTSPEDLVIGVVAGGVQVPVMMDCQGDRSSILGLGDARQNESTFVGKALKDNAPSTVVISVRRGRILATADGKTIIDWKGDVKRVSSSEHYKVPNPKALFLGAWKTGYRFTQVLLTGVSGSGRMAR